MKPRFIIAAASSGSGKTTLTMGLLRALSRQGFCVQPFKCGPDYIDMQFHTLASGRESVNLDVFMASEKHVRTLFRKYGNPADACIVEGVMGLFDGYDRMKGSSADIARLLDLPVLLVVNTGSSAYSVAATLWGFKHFRPDVRVAGVVFNKVGSVSHFHFLQDACADAGVECVGYLPKDESLQVPSRHLGLTLSAREDMERFINRAADRVEQCVDTEKLLELMQDECPDEPDALPVAHLEGHRKIAVARDEAFNFIYRENLARLQDMGSVAFFSPLRDTVLPEADFVYLPGGYPELFAKELADNSVMRQSVRDYAEGGGKMLAECGGMIYLSRSIHTGGTGYPMCGVLPVDCSMTDARLHLGYRYVDMGEWHLRGHEFHYSDVLSPDALPSVARQRNAKGRDVETPLYRHKNVFAGYTHLYWGETGLPNLWKE